MTPQSVERPISMTDDETLIEARRNVYRLQTGGVRLCDALRKIADGADNPEKIAKAALAHKEADPDWPLIEDLRQQVERLEEWLDALCDSVEREEDVNGSLSGALMSDMREARARSGEA